MLAVLRSLPEEYRLPLTLRYITGADYATDFALSDARGQIAGFGMRPSGTRAFLLTPIVPGDLNCDGSINFGDINPFVLGLSAPIQWLAQFHSCDLLNGDINGDGSVDFSDINPFVALLSRR